MRSVLAVVLLSTVACGGGSDNSGPITRGEAAEDYAFLFCGYELGCGALTPDQYETCRADIIDSACAQADCSDEVATSETLASLSCAIGWYDWACNEIVRPECPLVF